MYYKIENKFYRYYHDIRGNKSRPVNGVYITPTAYFAHRNYNSKMSTSLYDTKTRTWQSDFAQQPTLEHYAPGTAGVNELVAEAKLRIQDTFDNCQLTKDTIETLNMTSKFFSRVPAAYRYLRKFKFKKAYMALTGQTKYARKSIPDTFLAFQFGVKPYVSELQEKWERIRDKQSHFRVTASASRKGEYLYTNFAPYTYVGAEPRYTEVCKWIESVKIYRYYNCGAFAAIGKSQHSNPLPALWDGVPWSFVLDWFVPISDALQQVHYAGITATSGCNCYKFEQKYEAEVIPSIFTSPDGRLIQYWTSSHCTDSQFRRYVDSTVALSGAELMAHLDPKSHLSLNRCLNLFMIAWQKCLK